MNSSQRKVIRLDERASASRGRRSATETQLLSRIIQIQSDIAAAGFDPKAVVDVIATRAQELTDSSGVVIELLDGDSMYYWVALGSAADQVGLRIGSANSLSGLSARTGRVLRCDDSETDDRVDREACRRVGLRSMVVVPLVHLRRTIGVLKVLSTEPNSYNDEHIKALELMASLIGASLSNALEHSRPARGHSHLQRPRSVERRDAIVRRIRRVIDRREFDMVFQPICDLRTGRIRGFEALTRFQAEPYRSPDHWFAEAASVDLGVDLELAAVKMALDTFRFLPEGVYLSVNLSPEAVCERFEEIIADYDASRIVVEITEHARVADYALLEHQVARLRSRGVRIAIDDAGAGFASLRHILKLDPDLIKLDMSLTHDIDQTARLQDLALALVAFAKSSRAAIIAESIETDAELVTLKRLGVDFGQGYYLGRPEPWPLAAGN